MCVIPLSSRTLPSIVAGHSCVLTADDSPVIIYFSDYTDRTSLYVWRLLSIFVTSSRHLEIMKSYPFIFQMFRCLYTKRAFSHNYKYTSVWMNILRQAELELAGTIRFDQKSVAGSHYFWGLVRNLEIQSKKGDNSEVPGGRKRNIVVLEVPSASLSLRGGS